MIRRPLRRTAYRNDVLTTCVARVAKIPNQTKRQRPVVLFLDKLVLYLAHLDGAGVDRDWGCINGGFDSKQTNKLKEKHTQRIQRDGATYQYP